MTTIVAGSLLSLGEVQNATTEIIAIWVKLYVFCGYFYPRTQLNDALIET